MNSTPKILIANRGEIALRIFKTCFSMGISSVAIHSEVDKNLIHVRLSDQSVCVGPAVAQKSYMNMLQILSACYLTGANAVHPGYGFLSEDYRFPQILSKYNINFIGPSFQHIALMGDKITAKQKAEEIGLPVLPGSPQALKDLEEAISISSDIGYPVILKASGGGGGRGMKVVFSQEELRESWPIIKSEAEITFKNGDIYLEKFLTSPKHIEIQVFGDQYGNVAHLGERECSVQRRNQKMIEEAPSPSISDKERDYITQLCVKAMKSIQYTNAGTIEFLYEDGNFYFIEMNTRIQVEHCITEMIYNCDIVKEQISIAFGDKISIHANKPYGHSIECRINAEDPTTFIPQTGQITYLHVPTGKNIRFESSIYSGYTITPFYDSMIGKLIVYADTRQEAIRLMKICLQEIVIEGVSTSIPRLRQIIDHPDFIDGTYNTSLVSSL